MTVYVLAQMSVHDRFRYERYASRFMPTLLPFGGRLLAADEQPEQVQGTWPHEKVVIIEFPDRATAMGWMESNAYQEISGDRLSSTTGVAIIVYGVDERATVSTDQLAVDLQTSNST